MKKKATKNRLKAYSALAGAALTTVAANGQIVYTDIDDVTLDEIGDYYDLDMNNDGVVDFKLKVSEEEISYYGAPIKTKAKRPAPDLTFTGASIFSNGINRVAGNGMGGPWSIANAFEDSISIYSKNADFYGYNSILRGEMNYSYYGPIYLKGAPDYSIGDFDENTDKYIGVAFTDKLYNKTFHGWIRVNVQSNEDGSDASVTIKDFAYNKFPYAQIMSGIGANMPSLSAPSNVVLSDIGDHNTAADMKVSFDAAADESDVDMYGVYIVKADSPISTIEDINEYVAEPIFIDTASQSSYESILSKNAVDVDGDLIVTGKGYRALVFTIDESFMKKPSSVLSNLLTLNIPDVVADSVTLEDKFDTDTYSDLVVDFAKAKDEANIQEYRIVIINSDNLNDVDSAKIAATTNFTKVVPNGANHNDVVIANKKALNNNDISAGNNYYQAIVVTVLKNNEGFVYSQPSNEESIGIGTAHPVTDLKVNDVSDRGDFRDIEFVLTVPENPANFGGNLRFAIVPEYLGNLTEQDIISGKNISYNINKDSAQVDTIIGLFPLDYTGQPIQEGVKYKVYPITPNSGNYTKAVVGTPAGFMLTSSMGEMSDIFVAITGSTNPSDWRVICDGIDEYANLDEYRIFIVKDGDAISFDLTAALSIKESGYLSVKPQESRFSVQLSADMKDIDGNVIETETGYRIFVLAYGNEKATVSVLSAPSNKVALVSVLNIDEEAISESIYAIGKSVSIDASSLSGDADIAVYSTQGQAVYSGTIESGKVVINLDNVSAGIYIINVQAEGKVISKKLFIE